MNKLLLISLWALATSSFTGDLNNHKIAAPKEIKQTKVEVELTKDPVRELYDEMHLAGTIKWEAFEEAMQGYNQLNPKNKNIITIIDFTLPSTEKRMYVLDLKGKKMLYHSLVSHGRNSGEKFATSFSNKHGSFQSSLGFYFAEETYMGGNGYSLRLDGLEKGINDQARPRAVVVHGADYASANVIKSTGRLGRSYGCPALPREVTKPIINTIKGGSLMYIYAGNKQYLASTKMIKKGPVLTDNKTLIATQHDEVETGSGKATLN